MRVLLNNIKIGENIHNARMNKNISINQLSNEIEISEETLTNYEAGKKLPNLENCIKICNYFQMRLDDLLVYNLE